jgi:hypothetical protein
MLFYLANRHITYGWTELAKRLSYRQPSFLVQMGGPNPTREVTEKSARRFERDLGLPVGSLDVLAPEASVADQIRAVDALVNNMPIPTPVFQVVQKPITLPAPAPLPDDESAQFVHDTIQLVAKTIEQQGVKLEKMKHLQIVNMAIGDAIDNGGKVNVSYIVNMVKLLK